MNWKWFKIRSFHQGLKSMLVGWVVGYLMPNPLSLYLSIYIYIYIYIYTQNNL